ncbi:hypothetical protein [Clostridium saccharobutylicum]|uniref:Uncharacterized protein n=1 Tax=Clostridium saccharobutylicum DSM 13864 TaxID=1345695 RepID=U5MXZ7_CLOSA|nr:hypothetical protein [Clostridium saccharobutylicum]AGX44357.1 hypothetical protein CLSA_c33940 [Clostridium saccharobutylicum DSM 13864]AQR91649.1 hypothetical protein CLOSC_33750 [Clostridium saccharobutylicum]AQS01554.1 hypothetical protein CSACC_33830 [Clostridium saccharobutylicum]AQS11165.1 hypothetical protein CLOBY_33190 [Clostridium saccharobutylicum]AQS15537.1 hypothetical protein CLOSACC_33830 [Clostridium saccharobutylicum]
MENIEQMSQEINELKQKYDSIIQKLDTIEKENQNKEVYIKQTQNNFETINNTMKELMEKINSMVEDKEANKMFNNSNKSDFSFKDRIASPMKKFTIKTIGTVFTMADYASEKMSYAKESLEDIVAEAQYESKKKRATVMSNSHS